jgi:hypothetical protein
LSINHKNTGFDTIDGKQMNPIAVMKRYLENVERSRQLLEEIRAGIANLTDVTNRHLVRLIELTDEAAQEAKRHRGG